MNWRDYQDMLARHSNHWSRNRFRSLAANVARYLPGVSGSCLEVGCGEGLITWAVKREHPGLRVIGSDISHARLSRAAENVAGGLFVSGDIFSLPWKNETFDAVICSEVLEHIPDQEKALDELFRVVRKGGFVLVTVPDREKLVWNICSECGSRVYKHGHIRSYTPEDVAGMLESRGKLVTVVSIGKKWRLIKRRLASIFIPGRPYKGRYLLGLAGKQ